MARLNRTTASASIVFVLLAVAATHSSASPASLRKLLTSCHRDACGIWCGPPRGGVCAETPAHSPSPSYYHSPSPSYPGSPSPSYPSPSPETPSPTQEPEECEKEAMPECKHPGFAYDSASSECVKEDFKPVEYSCDSGYTLKPNTTTCEKTLHQDVEHQCPPDYDLKFNIPNYENIFVCTKLVQLDPETLCQSFGCVGYDMVEPVLYCSDNRYSISGNGTGDSSGDCDSSGDSSADSSGGDSSDGSSGASSADSSAADSSGSSATSLKCTYTDTRDANNCTSPYEFKDGQCYLRQTDNATFTCEDGFELNGQICQGPCDATPTSSPPMVTEAPPTYEEEEKGCIGNLPFGLENCVCDGAMLGMAAGEAACGRVASECKGIIEFSGAVEAVSRICDTFAIDSCLSASMQAVAQLPGCKSMLAEGTAKCTSHEALRIFQASVSMACEPLCPHCARMEP